MLGKSPSLWNVRINGWVIRTCVQVDIAVLDNVVVLAFILKLLLELLVLDYQVGDSRVERCDVIRVLVYLLLELDSNVLVQELPNVVVPRLKTRSDSVQVEA